MMKGEQARVRRERRLRRSAEHAARVKDTVLAATSHELRTPGTHCHTRFHPSVHGALGLLQVLQGQRLTPDAASLVN